MAKDTKEETTKTRKPALTPVGRAKVHAGKVARALAALAKVKKLRKDQIEALEAQLSKLLTDAMDTLQSSDTAAKSAIELPE